MGELDAKLSSHTLMLFFIICVQETKKSLRDKTVKKK